MKTRSVSSHSTDIVVMERPRIFLSLSLRSYTLFLWFRVLSLSYSPGASVLSPHEIRQLVRRNSAVSPKNCSVNYCYYIYFCDILHFRALCSYNNGIRFRSFPIPADSLLLLLDSRDCIMYIVRTIPVGSDRFFYSSIRPFEGGRQRTRGNLREDVYAYYGSYLALSSSFAVSTISYVSEFKLSFSFLTIVRISLDNPQ